MQLDRVCRCDITVKKVFREPTYPHSWRLRARADHVGLVHVTSVFRSLFLRADVAPQQIWTSFFGGPMRQLELRGELRDEDNLHTTPTKIRGGNGPASFSMLLYAHMS